MERSNSIRTLSDRQTTFLKVIQEIDEKAEKIDKQQLSQEQIIEALVKQLDELKTEQEKQDKKIISLEKLLGY